MKLIAVLSLSFWNQTDGMMCIKLDCEMSYDTGFSFLITNSHGHYMNHEKMIVLLWYMKLLPNLLVYIFTILNSIVVIACCNYLIGHAITETSGVELP